MMPGSGAGHALPFWVPARFLLTGAVALAAFWTALALAPELALAHPAHPRVLALVHTLTLGFGALILVGAMHQLVPVLLVTRLHAPSWGTPTYLLLSAGSCAVIAGFAFGYRAPWLAAGGGAVWLGTALLALMPAALLLAAGRTPDAVALVLVGALPLAVAGMLVKIASFLAWQHRYAGRIGRAGGAGVPLLADMVVPPAGWVTLVALAMGAAATTAGRAGDAPALGAAGAWLGAVGAWTLVTHLAWIVFGRHRPRAKAAGAGSAAGEVAHAG